VTLPIVIDCFVLPALFSILKKFFKKYQLPYLYLIANCSDFFCVLLFFFLRGNCFRRSILWSLLLGVVPYQFFPALSCIKLPAGTVAAPPVLCLGTRGRSAHACPLNHSASPATCQPNINHLYYTRPNPQLLRLYTGERTKTASGYVPPARL
jgi:hypothetical protein